MLQFDVLVEEARSRHPACARDLAALNAVLARVLALLQREFGFTRFFAASPFLTEGDARREDQALDDATYLALSVLRDPAEWPWNAALPESLPDAA